MSDVSLVGCVGSLIVATCGDTGAGEFLLNVRGTEEACLASSDQPLAKGTEGAGDRYSRRAHGCGGTVARHGLLTKPPASHEAMLISGGRAPGNAPFRVVTGHGAFIM